MLAIACDCLLLKNAHRKVAKQRHLQHAIDHPFLIPIASWQGHACGPSTLGFLKCASAEEGGVSHLGLQGQTSWADWAVAGDQCWRMRQAPMLTPLPTYHETRYLAPFNKWLGVIAEDQLESREASNTSCTLCACKAHLLFLFSCILLLQALGSVVAGALQRSCERLGRA